MINGVETFVCVFTLAYINFIPQNLKITFETIIIDESEAIKERFLCFWNQILFLSRWWKESSPYEKKNPRDWNYMCPCVASISATFAYQGEILTLRAVITDTWKIKSTVDVPPALPNIFRRASPPKHRLRACLAHGCTCKFYMMYRVWIAGALTACVRRLLLVPLVRRRTC